MSSEYFNIFVDTDPENNKVTARVFQKHYKGLVCNVDSYEDPEDAFNKIKNACIKALESDFIERHDKIIKYINKPVAVEAAQTEEEVVEDHIDDSGYEPCMACQ